LGAIGSTGGAHFPPKERLGATVPSDAIGRMALLWSRSAGLYGNPYAGKTNEIAQKVEWHKNFSHVALGVFGFVSVAHRRFRRRLAKRLRPRQRAGMAIITLTGWMGGHLMDG
jgi:hypothetical protein